MKVHVFMLVALLIPGLTWAEEDSFFSVQYENDMITPNNRDRYYTSGFQISLLKKVDPPPLLDAVSKLTPFYTEGNEINLVQYAVGQKMFTPDDIVDPSLQISDRPYAGYLYFAASVLSRIKQEENITYGNQFEVTGGMGGPAALGKETQTGIHRAIGSDLPEGWEYQLKNEPALGLSYSRFWRAIHPTSYGLEFGVNPQLSGAVGNVYTYGAAGVMFRLGNNLRRDLGPPNIRPGFPGVTYFRSQSQSSWYVYLGLESRLVLRDIFLDGNTFEDSHSVEKEPLIGDMQYGFVYMFDDIRIAVSNMIRTREFKTQNEATQYGSINISYRY